jgi:electron transport complex protein RnfA
MDYRALIVIMMSTVLVNNYVLSQFLGICPFLGVSKELKNAAGMGVAVIFVMLLATSATWPIHTYLLEPNGLTYMQTVVFILVIAALVQLIEIVVRKYVPSLHAALGVYLPLMATNCAILAATIDNFKKEYNFIQSFVDSLGAGLGFLLAMVIFAGIREHTQNADPPPSFKGIPITLFSVAILSIAFFAFSGVAENMFGR